jgi:hypothetical protein
MVRNANDSIQFLSSRPTTPVPFRPKSLGVSAGSNGLSPLRQVVNGAPESNGDVRQSSVVANLEKVVNGQQ